MGALERLNVFEYLDPNTKFWREEGWQFAPMQMIFDMKQDSCRKARFVVGGHAIDSSKHTTYLSTIKDVSVRLLMLAAVKNGLNITTADIGNAFCTAPCTEKIWSIAGDEFSEKKGLVIVLRRALYGLKTASALFNKFLGDFLQEMGYFPSHADQDLWLEKLDQNK
eukprot:9670932-Ditylum_brightwellii.AAC.1